MSHSQALPTGYTVHCMPLCQLVDCYTHCLCRQDRRELIVLAASTHTSSSGLATGYCTRCKFPPLDATASGMYPVLPSATCLCRRGRPGRQARAERKGLPSSSPLRLRSRAARTAAPSAAWRISTDCSTNKTGALAQGVTARVLQQAYSYVSGCASCQACVYAPGRMRIAPQKT